jgi:hypothetical protein
MTSVSRLFALCAALVVAAPAALAHQASDAYLHWSAQDAFIEQRVDIALRDLDRELVLDADGDGRLTWAEVRERWAEIERLADEGVRLRAVGASCAVSRRGPAQLEKHADDTHAVLLQTWRCDAAVAAIEVDYTLFARSDAGHRGIVRVSSADDASTVLVPGAGPQRLALTRSADGAAPRSFGAFVREGLHHIAAGADHILFLVTLLMVAVWRREGAGWTPRASAGSAWRETLTLVTAFTLAHSLTLSLAAAGVLAAPSRWVESLIAASVLVAALDNIRPFVRAPRWAMVSVFGLAHGFGFAGPLQDLGLQRGALALPLLGFNLGVELGQLVVVAVLLPLAIGLREARLYRVAVVRGGSLAIAALAGVWFVERSLDLPILP